MKNKYTAELIASLNYVLRHTTTELSHASRLQLDVLLRALRDTLPLEGTRTKAQGSKAREGAV